MTVIYGGRLAPQTVDREAIAVQRAGSAAEHERRYAAGGALRLQQSSYWYPQAHGHRLRDGRAHDHRAGGVRRGRERDAAEASRSFAGPLTPGQRPAKQFVFDTVRPARYLACVISRFQVSNRRADRRCTARRRADGRRAPRPASDDRSTAGQRLDETNPREIGARRERTTNPEVLRVAAGRRAVRQLHLAITESDLPGGHSPAVLRDAQPAAADVAVVWRNDPVAFGGYPSFFIAHEIAHQWWGQAVGWKNYHEQWLSEGFAQYFAAMYAERERGAETFTGVIRQMRRWAIEMSPQGPVYLGYRLGHIKGDSRVFRALVYNKGAMVLHMLRRLVGDEAFFAGLREFYATWRFKKAGTDDFSVAWRRPRRPARSIASSIAGSTGAAFRPSASVPR